MANDNKPRYLIYGWLGGLAVPLVIGLINFVQFSFLDEELFGILFLAVIFGIPSLVIGLYVGRWRKSNKAAFIGGFVAALGSLIIVVRTIPFGQ